MKLDVKTLAVVLALAWGGAMFVTGMASLICRVTVRHSLRSWPRSTLATRPPQASARFSSARSMASWTGPLREPFWRGSTSSVRAA